MSIQAEKKALASSKKTYLQEITSSDAASDADGASGFELLPADDRKMRSEPNFWAEL